MKQVPRQANGSSSSSDQQWVRKGKGKLVLGGVVGDGGGFSSTFVGPS
jgi:hypothetical protein